MSRVAILVDLGFFLPRYRSLIECKADPAHSARRIATALFETAVRHVHREHGEQLYRIFVYDCKPLDKKAQIVLVTGDADFVPAAKLARREGVDVVLDPLWNHIAHSLHEHIDGLRSFWVKRDGGNRHEILKRHRSGESDRQWRQAASPDPLK